MTAILQAGDRIHLAFPVTYTMEDNLLEEIMKMYQKDYQAQGVTIEVWSAHTGLQHPVVVSIFRDSDTGSTINFPVRD